MFKKFKRNMQIKKYTLLGNAIKETYLKNYDKITNHVELSDDVFIKQFIIVSWHQGIGAMLHFLLVTKPPKLAVIMSNNPQNFICIPLFEHLNIEIIRQDENDTNAFARAKQIHHYLTEGYSIFNFSDGPNGPSKVFKKDMLFFSKKYKIPILPLIATADNYTLLSKSWDQSYLLNAKTSQFWVRNDVSMVVTDLEKDALTITKQLNELESELFELRDSTK